MVDKIKNGISHIFNSIFDCVSNAFAGVCNIFIGFINIIVSAINKINPFNNINTIPQMASGGIVTSPTLVNVG